MPDLETQIKEWREELTRTGIAKEVVDELETHLRERVDQLTVSGCPEPEAFQTAVQQLGDGKKLQTEFAKLKRGPWRIFRGNPIGINLLGAWFIFTGLNFLVLDLSRFCFHIVRWVQSVLVNYSFKDAGPILSGGFASFPFPAIMLGLWTITGIGLLRRWKLCNMAALWFASFQIYWRIYYYVLGHPLLLASGRPLTADSTMHYNILGWLVMPKGAYFACQYVVLAILIWGVCSLLRPWVEKCFRWTVAG